MNYTLYNSSEVERILRELVPLQDSIEQATNIFLQLGEKGFHKKLVEDWEATFRRYFSPDQHVKRLALMYLANDVVQKCRTRVPGYLESFREALFRIFRYVVEMNDVQIIEASSQLVELWKNRRVYAKEIIKEMQDILTNQLMNSAKKNGAPIEGENLPEGLIPVPQELVPFVDATRDLEKWKAKTIEAENKLKNSIRSDYFNEDEANLHLSEYKRCLELEQKYRTNLIKAQVELMRQLDTDHMKYTHMVKKASTLIEEIDNNF